MDSHNARSGRILVADDDAAMCDHLRGLLAEQYDVIVASDGEKALEAACEHDPDLVLSDVMIPRLDGYELVKRLRAQPQTNDLPIILLSARAAEEACVKALEDGADDYLINPFSARELLARVHTHVRLGKTRRALERELRGSNQELERLVQIFVKEIEGANAALHESEHAVAAALGQLEVITENMPAGVTRCSRDLKYLWVSPTYATSLGRTPEELAGRPIVDVIGQEGYDHILPYMKKALLGERVQYETQVTFLGAGRRWIQAVYVPTRGPGGEVDGWIAVVTDITERHELEDAMSVDLAALMRMQELSGKRIGEGGLQPLLQEIVNAAVAILAANQGTLQVVQNNTLRMVAHHGHESPFLEYFGRDQDAAFIRGERTIVEDVEKSPLFLGTPLLPVLHQAGVRSMQSTPLITRGGRMLGVLSTHWSVPHAPSEHDLWRLDLLARQTTDLMESAEAEEALRTSEYRLATTLRRLPIGVGIVDAAGKVVGANPAWNRLLRSDVPSIDATSWGATSSDGRPFPSTANPALRALGGEEVLPGIEFLRKGEDGMERWTRASAVPIRDETGQITGALAMLQDIDEERWAFAHQAELLAKERALKAEKAVREAESKLARVVRAFSFGELATSIAHEVNQPLAGVVTNAAAGLRWLRGEPPNVEEARESLALVARDGNRASAVIRRIRDSLRKGTEAATWFDLNEMIQETVVLAHANLEKERVIIQTELPGDAQRVRGDRIQLQQVILNLLVNGAEAMAKVEGARELRIQTRRTDAGVVVAVRDRGPGINPENLTRLFDAFFTTKPDGIGMGLSISRTIVEAHGGRIWADLNEGPGLTVQFELPADSASTSHD